MNKSASKPSPLMTEVSAYIAGARKRALPKEVTEKTKHHILDTLAAMVSGSKLLPGKYAIAYVKALAGAKEACVVGTRIVTTAANAALANGMSAHADETDDSHHSSNMHPGCGIVSTALAMGERERCDGKSMVRAVALGYDIGCRVAQALRPGPFRIAGHANHSFGGIFGAAATAGAMLRLDASKVRYMLSYTAQQASGIRTFERDREHVLKAFIFGGMTSHNGITAAIMAACGFTAVEDEFSGTRNRDFFSIYSPNPKPAEMLRGLGNSYEIMNTNIKKWCVGSPVQAALDAVMVLMKEQNVKADNIEKLVVHTPADGAAIVNESKMPDINMQHLLAIMLLDGTLTFESAHDVARMKDRKVLELKKRFEFVGSAELTTARPPRQSIVEITTRDGRQHKHRTYAVKGTPFNPMTREEVAEKCLDLIAPVTGKRRARMLVDTIWNLEKVSDVRALRPLLSA